MKEIDSWLGKIHCGDCVEVMKSFPEHSIDAVITDVPYNLGEHTSGLIKFKNRENMNKANIPYEFTYMYQPPRRYTFEMPKLLEWLKLQCKGKILNLFAGKVVIDRLNETRVDIDPNMNELDFVMDSYEFCLMAIKRGWKWDTIILDPPYNMRKSREKYGSRWIGSFTKIKNLILKMINVNGTVISFGYDSVGMSNSRGFKKVAICLICHSGDHQDTIVVVERFISGGTKAVELKEVSLSSKPISTERKVKRDDCGYARTCGYRNEDGNCTYTHDCKEKRK